MFNIVKGVVRLPLSVGADVLTMGGELVDRDKPFTQENLEDLYRDLGG